METTRLYKTVDSEQVRKPEASGTRGGFLVREGFSLIFVDVRVVRPLLHGFVKTSEWRNVFVEISQRAHLGFPGPVTIFTHLHEFTTEEL